MKTESEVRCFEGVQGVYEHDSVSCACPMRFAVFTPPRTHLGKRPVLWWLSGLTCTHANFTEKAGAQRVAAELGLIIVAPDTSPRGQGVPDDPQAEYDFGLGAGFYVDATQEPWARNYQMRSYLERDLPRLIASQFPADMSRQAICGHSMGGHGALTFALREPGRFRSVSAFAPIAAPSEVPWGKKALGGYLGQDPAAWREHDACALLADGAKVREILVDQGGGDPFIQTQLRPDLLEAACAEAGVKLTLRARPRYDHSYFFISTFIEDHLRWHAERLA
ncbi:MAG: S-formylglutathione hydrolase [Caulobacterales bacterium]|nr:S-formylglutathione hydrolase [Caulobacterales bacterium]